MEWIVFLAFAAGILIIIMEIKLSEVREKRETEISRKVEHPVAVICDNHDVRDKIGRILLKKGESFVFFDNIEEYRENEDIDVKDTIIVMKEYQGENNDIVTNGRVITVTCSEISEEKLEKLIMANEDFRETEKGGNDESTILIVEDNMTNINILSYMVSKIGIKFDIAENDTEFMKLISEKKYGLIFMDINLPGSNGFELTQLTRKNRNNKNTPIIGVSAGGKKELEWKCIKAGMNQFVQKPFQIKDIYTVITKYFSNIKVVKRNLAEDNEEDKEFRKKLDAIIIETSRESIIKIERMIKYKMNNELLKEIHKFKSTFFTIKEKEMFNLLDRIENRLKAGEDILNEYNNFKKIYTKFEAEILERDAIGI